MSNTIHNLAYLGLIRISGPDAVKFLQGQTTCNVLEVTETQSRLGACCNLQGRMLAAFRLYQFQQDYFLRLPTSLIPSVLSHLKKYAVFSKVSLTDVSTEFSIIGCCGSLPDSPLKDFFARLPHNPDEITVGPQSLIARLPGDICRYEIIGTSAAIKEILQTLSPLAAMRDANDWKLQDIFAGISLIYPETQDEFFPHHVNYPKLNGVSFNKGCYLGQEIIARMHYRGQLKKHLYRAQSPCTLLKPSDKLYDDDKNVVGIIVESAKDQQNLCQLLIVLQDSALQSSIRTLAAPKETIQIL